MNLDMCIPQDWTACFSTVVFEDVTLVVGLDLPIVLAEDALSGLGLLVLLATASLDRDHAALQLRTVLCVFSVVPKFFHHILG